MEPRRFATPLTRTRLLFWASRSQLTPSQPAPFKTHGRGKWSMYYTTNKTPPYYLMVLSESPLRQLMHRTVTPVTSSFVIHRISTSLTVTSHVITCPTLRHTVFVSINKGSPCTYHWDKIHIQTKWNGGKLTDLYVRSQNLFRLCIAT